MGDNFQYRIGIIKSVGEYIKNIGPGSANDLVKIIVNGASDEKWRVRLQALETMMDFLKVTKK